MNVLDMTISRVSRISMALSLMLLASWVWFNFLTQPQAMNLFVTSPSMFQQVSLGNLRLPDNGALQDRSSSLNVAQLPQLQGSQLQLLELDSVEVISNSALNRDAQQLGSPELGMPQLGNQPAVTNFAGAAVQGGPAPLLPSAQRQNIKIEDLPFLVSAPPVEVVGEDEQIVIAAPSGRLTVNPFSPIYVEEELETQQPSPVVNAPRNTNQNTSGQVRATTQQVAQPVAEPLKPKIEIGTVPTPRPLLPPPSRQTNLPASLATGSLATKPSLLSAPIRASYYDASEVPEPVVIEIPAEVVEAPVTAPVEVVAEPVKLDRSRLTGIRMPVNGATNAQSGLSPISSRTYNTANNNDGDATTGLPSVTQAPASPTIAARLPQTAGVRPALMVPALQPIGLVQAQLIGRRNVPVVEAPEPVEVVEEVIVPEIPKLRPVQIALRVPEPVVQEVIVQEPVVQEPIVQAPVIQEVVEVPVVEEVTVQEAVAEEIIEEVDVVEIPTSQPYIASVSSTLDLAQPVVDTTTVQAVAADTDQSAATPADVAGATVVAQFVRDNNISFTGAILGSVSVAIFKGRMGSFHVPIGEYIPDTDIRLTNVKRHEVELRQGSESHIIYLDVGQ